MTLFEVHSPMWTDVVQALGIGLSLPVTIWGMFKLFIKDKEVERKLTALEQLAEVQNKVVTKMQDQIDQLALQSSQFQYQSNLMLEHNKLIEKQIDLQMNVFMHEKGSEEQKLNLERRKRLLEIRPFLFSSNCGTDHDGFYVELQNKAGHALNLKIIPTQTDMVFLHAISEKTNLDKGAGLRVRGMPKSDKTFFGANQVPFDIKVEYSDIDGNKYHQTIQKPGSGRYVIGDPILEEPGSTNNKIT